MRKANIIAAILPIFLITGCWDKSEMDDRNYVLTVGVDKYQDAHETGRLANEDSFRYTVSLCSAPLEQSNSESGGKTEGGGVKNYSGETFMNSIRTADVYDSRKVYLGHMKSVVFGEDILKDETLFVECLDSLERNQEINMQTVIIGVEGKAYEAAEVINTKSSGLFLWDFYKNNEDESDDTQRLTLENLLISLRENGCAIIPRADASKENVKLSGGIVISDWKFAGTIDENEQRGVTWLAGNARGANIAENDNGIIVGIKVIKSGSNLEFVQRDNKLVCIINITGSASLETYTGKELNDEKIENIEKIFEEKINSEANNALRKLQKEYSSDALNIASNLKKQNYNLYKAFGGNSNVIFDNMDFEIKTDIDISGIGVIK